MPDLDLSFDQNTIIIKPDRISRNSFWMLLGLISTTLTSFVTIFFLTRYLGPDKFGIYSVALSVAGLFFPLADLGLDLHLTRTVSATPTSIRREISKTLSAKVFLTAAFWLLTVGAVLALNYSTEMILYVSLFAVSFLLLSLAQTFVGALRAIQKMKFESISLFSARIIGMIGVMILIVLKGSLLTIILAQLLGSLVNAFTAVLFLRSQIRVFDFHLNYNDLRERFRGALPFGLTAVFVTIYTRIDIVILSKMVDDSAIGCYNAAYNFIMGSMMLSTPLVLALFPVLSSTFKSDNRRANLIFQEGVKYSMLLGLPLGLGSILMAGPIIALAYGQKFTGSILLLQIMSGIIPIQFASGMIGNSIGAVGYQGRVCATAAVCMAFNIIANLVLIPIMGAKGAAIAKISTEFLRLAQLWVLMRGIFKPDALMDFLKICACCVAALIGFILFDGIIGAWLAAAVFTLIFAAGAFWSRLLLINELRQIFKSSGGVA